MGMPTKNTIVVPCMVKMRLNTCGETKWFSGTASWMRMIVASVPATRKKTNPEAMYMSPRRLWSTVTTHSWSVARTDDRPGSRRATAMVGSSTAMVALAECRQVAHELLELPVAELHRRHERAGLHLIGGGDPGVQRLGRHPGGAGHERVAAHQVGEIRAEPAGRDRAPHGVAVDAGRGLEHAPAGDGRRVGDRRLLLRRHPAVELRPRVDVDPEQHVRVLCTAVLGAL